MGRRKRPHAPGMVFHLTARLHRREPWLVPGIRGTVSSHIQRDVGRTDADLLGYAIMPNHLHIVLRQGEDPLDTIMQPLLRRIAILVHARHRIEGTVFERRYRDRMCRSAGHVREALVYVHLNPWRAGLCDEGLDYHWTTQPAYLPGADPEAWGIAPGPRLDVLQLFARAERRSRDELCQDYLVFLRRRMSRDRVAGDPSDDPFDDGHTAADPEPSTFWGDRSWGVTFGGSWQGEWGENRPLPDLRDYLANQLAAVASGRSLASLRGPVHSQVTRRCRAELIRAAALRGYRTGAIASFFDISPATVSKAKHRRQ